MARIIDIETTVADDGSADRSVARAAIAKALSTPFAPPAPPSTE